MGHNNIKQYGYAETDNNDIMIMQIADVVCDTILMSGPVMREMANKWHGEYICGVIMIQLSLKKV